MTAEPSGVAFRAVLLMNNASTLGVQVADALTRRGLTLSGIVVEAPVRVRDVGRIRYPRWPRAPRAEKLMRWALARVRTHRVVRRLRLGGVPVIVGGPLNSPMMQEAIKALAPDYLILGGIGILSEATIATARHGVLNAHPGLLPWIRGTGVVGRAIERGVPVGATLHYVNAGIDRGAIIERRLLPAKDVDETLADLEARCDALIAEMLVDAACELLAQGRAPEADPQRDLNPICTWLSSEERAQVDAAVRSGRAAELFNAWAGASSGAPRFTLPRSFDPSSRAGA